MARVGIIGAGAWGTAFAVHLARMGHQALLWVYESGFAEIFNEKRENSIYLPGFPLDSKIRFTGTLSEAAGFSEWMVLATPSFALRSTLIAAAPLLAGKKILILTKGLERDTLFRMSEVAGVVLGPDAAVAVLSGPSFASEVAQGDFASVVVSSRQADLCQAFQQLIHNDFFRVYTSDDVIGVELGGAMKNVMAIGAGIVEGLGLGSNTQAAFTTRALAEIKRLGRAMGARETTFMGLSGVGDLILTSYGNLSRNRLFGIELSRGKKPDEVIRSQRTVVEGYYTIDAAYRLSQRRSVDMPITEQLYRIVYEGKDLRVSLNDITRRDYRPEDD